MSCPFPESNHDPSVANGVVTVLMELDAHIPHNVFACQSCRPFVCSSMIYLEMPHSDTQNIIT